MKTLNNILLILLFSVQSFAASTGELFYFFYPEYYEKGEEVYTLNFCHKNNAKLLKALKNEGANLEEIEVLIIQQDKTKSRLSPQNGRFDNQYAWHVVLFHDGIVYDLNAKYSETGVGYEDYFPYVLGFDTKLENVMLRVINAKRFYDYFYHEDGKAKAYNADHFVKHFLSTAAKTPLSSAKMLKWYIQ